MHEVTVECGFETAHRLPHVPGKCQSLHGHSWRAWITVAAPAPGGDGMLVEFGALKEWVRTRLDHGAMLGPGDPLVAALRAENSKVCEVPGWPTVENVAAMIADAATSVLQQAGAAPGCRVTRVHVRETAANEATWLPD